MGTPPTPWTRTAHSATPSRLLKKYVGPRRTAGFWSSIKRLRFLDEDRPSMRLIAIRHVGDGPSGLAIVKRLRIVA